MACKTIKKHVRILHFRHIFPKLLAQNMTGAERAGCEQLMYESEVMMMEGVSSAQTVTDVDTLVTTHTLNYFTKQASGHTNVRQV